MNETMSANSLPESILNEIKEAIVSKEYGSVEIYIESGRVVQITERTIKKTASVKAEGYNSAIRRVR
ncbi:MAG TPA: DUF2292 domain-containing protein [Candidatus Nanoarchaeia archaeon]|nr:hypothetical protein [uncultured archaeon]